MKKVNEIEYKWMKKDKEIGKEIKEMKGRRLIFKNGDRGNDEREERRIGIIDNLEDILDIVEEGIKKKKERENYERFIGELGVDEKRDVMFEEIERNIVVKKEIGMKKVMVVKKNFEKEF